MHATTHPATSPRTLPLRHCPLALALAAALIGMPATSRAQAVAANQLPTGGSIAGGTGTINAASGATLTIDQTSSRMALNWSAFDIGSAATVTFNQPSTNAAVLNLVQGGNPTQIFGNLNANGQVFLLNSNGIIFGSTANINVGGLVASTLGTTAANFMSGNDVLDAGGNTVALTSNSGTINAAAGSVNLIGGKVVNDGTITATAGNINLAGADRVTLTFETGGFGVVVDRGLQLALDSLAVDNRGTLSAPGGTITLQARAASGIFNQLINNSGVIRAAALSGSDGNVSLVANGVSGVAIGGNGSIDVDSGSINYSTNGSVQQTGALTAGTLFSQTSGSASFTGSNRIATLGAVDALGNLSVSNTIGLTQSGALTVGGTSTFSLAGQTLTLTDGGNQFTGAVNLSSGATRITDSGALTLGTLTTGNLTAISTGALNLGSGTVTGTLEATSNNGAITQSTGSGLTVTGTSNLQAGTGAITLTTGSNDFQQAVSLAGGVTQITDGGALTLGTLATGNLTATSTGAMNLGSGTVNGALLATSNNGAITQSTASGLTVTGTSSLQAGTGAITLTTGSNDFQQAVGLSGGATQIVDRDALQISSLNTGALSATTTGALTLGNGTVGGALTAISNGGVIGQTGTLNVTGNSTINAGSGAIALGNDSNDFTGGLSLTGTDINVHDRNNLSITALGSGANGAVDLFSNATLTLAAFAIDTGTASLRLASNGGALSTAGSVRGGTVNLRARDGIGIGHNVDAGALILTTGNAAVTQTAGDITVAGVTTAVTGTGALTLTGAGNNFSGALNLTTGNVQLNDRDGLTLGTLSTGALSATSTGALTLGGGRVSGNLSAASNGGPITQTGALTVTGSSALDSGSGTTTLINAGNDFQGAISLAGNGISVRDANDLTVAGLTPASNGAVSLLAGGTLSLPAQALDTGTGDLSLISLGGALSTAGALGGNQVTLRARDALGLGHNLRSGSALTLTSDAGAIVQTAGAIVAAGSATATAAVGSGAISLDGAGNDFGGLLSLTGATVRVSDSGALTLGTLTTGDLTVTSAGALQLGSGTIDGALVAISNNGAISQSTGSGLTVAGTSDLQAGTGAITLTTGSNDFRQAVSLTGGSTQIVDSGALTLGALNTGNLTVTNNGALDLGSGTVNGALVATSNNGAIGQSAGSGLTVTGTGTLQAGTGAITLTTGSNDFRQAVSLTGGSTQIVDSGALTLGALNSGNLTVTSNGTLNLGSGTVAGTLSATSGNAAIGQADALIVTGAANLDAGSGTIALNDVDNDFRSGVSLTGTGISVHDRDDLTVTSLTSGANGAIALTAEGALTLPTQNLSTGTGALSLTANGGALSTLGSLAGGNVSLRARDGLSLNHDVTASGTLGLTASNAAITQNAGVLDVGGLASVDAGTGAISLERDNDFKGGIALTGRNIGVVDANDLSVTSLVNGGTGNIALTARNALSLPATGLTSDGVMTLRAENGALALGGDLVGDAISLFSGNALTLATSISSLTGSGTLSVSTNNSAINQTAGILSIGGASTFNAGSGSIALGRIDNDFRGVVNLTGSGTLVRDSNALTLGAVSTGALTAISDGALTLGSGSADSLVAISSGHAITQTGALTVRQGSAVIAGGGSITLDNANNDFQSGLTLAGSGITVQDRNDLTLTSLTSNNNGNVAVTAGGSLTLPATSVNAGGGDLNLTANGGRVNIGGSLSGRNVALSARDGMTLSQSINATGNLALSSTNAAITQNAGALTAGGATTVDAGTGSIALLGAGNDFNTVSLAGNGIGLTDSNDLGIAALTSTGNGDVAVTAGGTLSLSAQPIALGNGNLTLSSNGGALSTGAALSGNTVTLFARDGLTLGHTVSANTLDLRSSNAAIAQSGGALNVVGATTVDAGSGSIALNGAGNRFGTGIGLTGTGIAVADSGTLTITALNAGANGSIALTAGGALNLSAQTLDTGSADLSLIANGGSVSTGGDLRGRNVALSARDGLTIGHGITATQALTLSSTNAAITQTAAALAVGTTTTIDAGSGNVVLGQAGNAFNGVIDLTAGDARITGNALTFGTLSTNALTASSNGALTLGRGVVRGALNGSSGNAAITQSGALSVGGASTLNAGSGDISLINPDNDFVGAIALQGNAIALRDRNDLSIAAVQGGADAAVSLVAGAGLNLPASRIDTGNGALTLIANGGSLRTNGALRGGDVQVTGANGIVLTDALTAGGTLSLNTTNAAITQTGGALLVAGNTVVNAGSGTIALDAAGNDFQGLLALTGGATRVRDANALTLDALDTGAMSVASNGALNLGLGLVNGDLDAASNGGAVTQTGALTVTGATRIDSAGATIVLADAGNDFQSALSLSGGDTRVRDRNGLTLGNLDVGALDVASGAGLDLGQGRIGGALVARSGGAAVSATPGAMTAQALAVPAADAAGINQQGALTVVGTSTLDAGTAAIVLTDAGNDFQGNVQARGGRIAIVDRNDLAAAVQASGAVDLQAGGQFSSSGAIAGGTVAVASGGALQLGHDLTAGTVSLRSGGAIAQSAGSLRAGQLGGSAAGAATLTGAGNAIGTLADFSAQGLDVFSAGTLQVSGRVDGGALLRLNSGGTLLLDGQLSGATSWLQAAAGIRQRAGSTLTAGLLGGSANGPVTLGDADSFLGNRVVRLGNFTANDGFSLTNAGDLTLVLANGSVYSVDAGNSALYLSVRGDLLQEGRATLRDGTGSFSATGRIGTQQDPIYLIGTGSQTIGFVGMPPAYFNATTAAGGLLDLSGGSSFNVPASAFAGRAQSSASRTIAFVDLSASGTPYRAFGLIRPGLRLPDDQQPACDAGDPDAVCAPQ
ncbi:filamentous hemagglutinin N-terminal domain-containing protein [Xanthomonas melonis]|uniref:Filamentous hemagglutinin N-terminal domain-containing protein n=2 Tax=Xanthomonas melonis TaxID=56456 RepID=A0ABS8NV04_9XANT|nr:filamentous hemagglutinin N-terminal domain-containing protein [Xanthomonas melonis]MCD0258441.1 filamentous hemagglutinin N-terminal domain-containing protein [Xanthomonas melonis]MCD0266661.1 filamentous hemagglutinin N-terminal domain-containing protein [Xanthomonas melonis]